VEEGKVLREQLGRKPRFIDDPRRRLTANAKKLSRGRWHRLAIIVSHKVHLNYTDA
jgi:hypothetical protein